MIMKEKLFEIGKYLGLEIIGVTSVLDYGYLQELFMMRQKNNYYNEFEEKNIKKRLDVRNVFPKCRSIIAVAIPYAYGYRKINTQDKGVISVVSYGEDYHRKVYKILEQYAEKIKENYKSEYVICVDTSPLVDREICKNAGIGNYGANCLLINDSFGSFINLGYILSDIEIEETGEVVKNKDICNGCSICINSCPNNAIQGNGIINTKKCISYLTQTKSYIPLEYRKNMGNQIYGCDICQLVCPKNKKNQEMKSENDYNNLVVNLDEMLTMTNKSFINKYGQLAGSWRGKGIWKRNALIAIGNLDLKSMFSNVKTELDNPSEMIKIYAAWSLMEINRHEAKDILNIKMNYEEHNVMDEYKKLLEV